MNTVTLKPEMSPSHVAVLVPSVRKAADHLRTFGYHIGDEGLFEETREAYVNGRERNSLLLMEPRGPGSYQRALEKRGPGIHHMAVDVLDLEKSLSFLSGSGWLLHLNSLRTIKDIRTAYLARPGFPALIEVQEKRRLQDGPLFVEGIELNFDPGLTRLAMAVGLGSIVRTCTGNSVLTVQGRSITLSSLF